MGEMRPIFHFDTIMATTIATMKAAVPAKGPCTGIGVGMAETRTQKEDQQRPEIESKVKQARGLF